MIGAKVGDAVDDRDRACIGHSLALADTGRAVSWTNPTSRIGCYPRRREAPIRSLIDPRPALRVRA